MVERIGHATATRCAQYRSTVTTFFADRVERGEITLDEDAAHHARVKRLSPGDSVSLTDGRGRLANAQITRVSKASVAVEVSEVAEVMRPSAIHLFVPVADKDRMLWLAEKATELQVASWNPVMYERSRSVSPRGEGEAFERKTRARMVSALEQSGGSWLPEMESVQTVGDIAGRGGVVLQRDASALAAAQLTPPVNLAIGPEGGFTPAELSQLVSGGWSAATLGGVTLRFETAAIAAVAVVRAHLP